MSNGSSTVREQQIEVDSDGLISGLFVWDKGDGDFRNVRLDELKNPLFDCVEDKDAYFALLLQQNASMRKRLDEIYRAVGIER